MSSAPLAPTSGSAPPPRGGLRSHAIRPHVRITLALPAIRHGSPSHRSYERRGRSATASAGTRGGLLAPAAAATVWGSSHVWGSCLGRPSGEALTRLATLYAGAFTLP